MEALADKLAEFRIKVLGTMQGDLSPSGAAIAIGLLVSLNMPVFDQTINALRALSTRGGGE